MDDLAANIHGSVSFERNVRFYGKVEGDLTILPDHILELHGHVGRDLIVEVGATAIVYGRVGGHILNKGGQVFMNGASANK